MVRWKTKSERKASSKRLWAKEHKIGTLLKRGSSNIRNNIHYTRGKREVNLGIGTLSFGRRRRKGVSRPRSKLRKNRSGYYYSYGF